jgi:phosphatidylglycerophosphate synthase
VGLAPETATADVAGLPHLVRTACALRAAGIGRIVVVGRVDVTAAAADARLAGTTLEALPEPPGGDPRDPILVARGDRVCHRDGPRLLAKAAEQADVGAAPLGIEGWGDALVVTSRARASAPGPLQTVPAPFLGFAAPLGDPAAERGLLLSLRKPIDGLAARAINRYVSLWVTRRLMRTRIRPNHITVFTMACGVAAAAVCALGGWTAAFAGVLLLELGSILDGVDGELARLKYQGSRRGEWLDTISDDLANACWIAGAAANLAAAGSAWAWPAAGIALGCFLLSQGLSYAKLVRIGSGDLLAISWNVMQGRPVVAFLYLLVKRDFFVTLFVALVAVGRLDVVLAVCVAGAVGVAIAVTADVARASRRPRRA